MKKIFLTAIAAMTMSFCMAQSNNTANNNGSRRGPRQLDATQMTERMTKELSLTDAQKTMVLALNKKFVEQMQKQQAEGKDNRKEYETNLKKILTSDQQKVYEQQKRKRGGQRRGRSQCNRPSQNSTNAPGQQGYSEN